MMLNSKPNEIHGTAKTTVEDKNKQRKKDDKNFPPTCESKDQAIEIDNNKSSNLILLRTHDILTLKY